MRRCAIGIGYLKGDGYSPWRYQYMTPPMPVVVEPKYEIDFKMDRW